MSSICFIDGDLIKFKLGFVGQKDSVDIYDEADQFVGNYKNKTQAFDELGSKDFRIEPKVEPKPWDQVAKIGRAMIKNIVAKSGCDKFRIYVDGKGNFRHDLATIKPYKGTRSGLKPYYYERIEKWLVEDMKGIFIEDIEVDDAVCIAMDYGFRKKLKYVGATTDKDAKGTVGWLLNYDTMEEPEFIDETNAARAFWTQMLSGDNVDNIQGCRQAGAGCKEAKLIESTEDELEMFWLVANKYLDKATRSGLVSSYREKGKTLTVEQEFLENCRLLRMLTWKDPKTLWHPVKHGGIPKKEWNKFVKRSKEVSKLWESD